MREELFEQAFTKQKNNCIQAFKALGEENRLIHVLNEIEREKLTYKAYFKVGYECCKTEVDELQVKLNGAEERASTCLEYKDKYRAERDELQKQLIDQGQRFNMQNQQITSLKKQLERLGYTDNGGELMKPPIGESPKFDVLDDLRKRVDAAIYLLPSIKAENDLWGCDQVERQIELLEQALKGGEDANQ